MAATLFLGRILATPGALRLLESAGQDPAELLARHSSGDWGEIPPKDARENELSVREGFRVVSAYPPGYAPKRDANCGDIGNGSSAYGRALAAQVGQHR